MPDYLFTARTSEGRTVTDRITAPTVDAARYALETRRYADIIFHTDDQTNRLDLDGRATELPDLIDGRRAIIARQDAINEFSRGIAGYVPELGHDPPTLRTKRKKASLAACLLSLKVDGSFRTSRAADG